MTIGIQLDQRRKVAGGDGVRDSATPQLRYIALGLLLLQVVWIFAVPPFRGTDEFDHVYRAASVARGEWITTPTAATRGTGAWVTVPHDIQEAAQPECQQLHYTTHADCVGTRHGDFVTVASGAGRYHPFFYALVGVPALPFSGYTALYIMRFMTVLLTWVLFCLALAATRTWATTRWPYVTLAVACTPVLIFSSGIVAPNGPEMTAALALWSALIGLFGPSGRVRTGGLLVTVAISGALLCTLRSLGPVFCVLVFATALLVAPAPIRKIRSILKVRASWAAALVVLLSALQSTWWILSMGSLDVSGQELVRPIPLLEKIWATCIQAVLWIFQSIAAFPYRNVPANPCVYFCYLVLFGVVLVLGLRRSQGSVRVALWVSVVVSLVFPFVLAVATFDTHAGVWQGRYGLPYAAGMVLLAGLALDRRAPRISTPTALGALMLFAIAQAMGPVGVLVNEAKLSPLRNTSAWLQPSPYVLGVGAVAGSVLMLGAALHDRGRAT